MNANWIHVYPVNDLWKHDLETFDCACSPKIDYVNFLVIHNSLDGREFKENIEKKES